MVKNRNIHLINKKNYIGFIFVFLSTFLFFISAHKEVLSNDLDDPYTIRNVLVDVTSSSTTLARDIAINKAQIAAYHRLINRLVILSHINKVPKIKDQKIIEMIATLQIEKEKALDKRYLGTFIVQFNSTKIREFLRLNNISFSESISHTQILIPVYEKEGMKILWDDPNEWRIAWNNLSGQKKVFPIFLPEGSIADIATINAIQAISGNEKSLDEILKRYNLKNGVIVHGVLVQDLNADLLRLHVTVRKFGHQRKTIDIQTYSSRNRNSEKKLLKKSVEGILENLVESWKLENIIHFDRPNKINVNVITKDIYYWNNIKALVRKIRIVEKIEVLKINKNDSQVIIHFFGERDQLISSLARKNIKLFSENNYWKISINDKN